MLIQFEKSTRAAYGATSDCSRLDMREGASRNPAIQLRAVSSIRHGPAVAQSRSEETTVHSYSSNRDHGDAEFRDSVVFYVLGILFLTPLILAGIAVKFG